MRFCAVACVFVLLRAFCCCVRFAVACVLLLRAFCAVACVFVACVFVACVFVACVFVACVFGACVFVACVFRCVRFCCCVRFWSTQHVRQYTISAFFENKSFKSFSWTAMVHSSGEHCLHGAEMITHACLAIEHISHCTVEFGKRYVEAIVSFFRNLEPSALILCEAGAETSAFFMQSLPSMPETCLIGIGCFLKACVKIYDVFIHRRSLKTFVGDVLKILGKYAFIASSSWLADFFTKFLLGSIVKGLSVGAAVVFNAVLSGISCGYIGYKLGEFIGESLTHLIPNPKHDDRSKWITIAKWTGFALGVATGVVLGIFCPPAAIILGAVAVSMIVVNVLDSRL